MSSQLTVYYNTKSANIHKGPMMLRFASRSTHIPHFAKVRSCRCRPTQREHEGEQIARYYILPPLRLHFDLNFLRSLPCKFLALA